MFKFTAAISVVLLFNTHAVNAEVISSDADEIFNLPLEDLLQLKVSISSHFSESNLTAANTVSGEDRQYWQQRSSRNLWDVLARQAGTWVMESPVGTRAVQYRGMAIDPGVRGTAMIIDGIPVNGSSFQTGLYFADSLGLETLNRIETIRGPSSVLYGSDAFQGAIGLQTFSANKDQLEISQAAGSTDYYMSSIRWSEGLPNGLRLSASYQFEKDDPANLSAFALNAPNPKTPGLDATQTQDEPLQQYSTVWTLSSDPKANISSYISVLRTSREETLRRTRMNGVNAVNTTDNHSHFNLIHTGLNAKLANETTLESKLYHWQSDFQWQLNNLLGPQYSPFEQHAKETRQGFDALLKQQNKDFNMQWSAGYSFSQYNIKDFSSAVKTTPATPLVSVKGVDDYDRGVHSLFGNVRSVLIDDYLHIVVGLRLDNYEDFGTQVSRSFGIIVQPRQDISLKLLYGHAFRAPGAAEINQSSTPAPNATFGNPDIRSEIIDTYELVFMQQAANWETEFVLFYSELNDGILLGLMPTTDSRYVDYGSNLGGHKMYTNANASISHGGEAKYSYHKNAWSFSADVSYSVGRNTASDFNYDAFPRWISNLNSDYKITDTWSSGLTARLMLDRKTFQTQGINSSSELNDYYNLDLHLRNQLSAHWDVRLDLRNILDKDDNYLGTVTEKENRNYQHGRAAWITTSFSF